MPVRTAKSCGPDLPMLGSSSQAKQPAGDGGNKARFTGESTYKPLNHRAGKAGLFRRTCGPNSYAFCCIRGYGCGWHPAFPALSVVGGPMIGKTSGRTCRGNAAVCPSAVIPGRRESVEPGMTTENDHPHFPRDYRPCRLVVAQRCYRESRQTGGDSGPQGIMLTVRANRAGRHPSVMGICYGRTHVGK